MDVIPDCRLKANTVIQNPVQDRFEVSKWCFFFFLENDSSEAKSASCLSRIR